MIKKSTDKFHVLPLLYYLLSYEFRWKMSFHYIFWFCLLLLQLFFFLFFWFFSTILRMTYLSKAFLWKMSTHYFVWSSIFLLLFFFFLFFFLYQLFSLLFFFICQDAFPGMSLLHVENCKAHVHKWSYEYGKGQNPWERGY